MTKTLRCLAAALAVAAAGAAQAQIGPAHGSGPYLVGALGVNQYDYDCSWAYDCRNRTTGMAKVGGGVRLGFWGVEAWYADFGRADIQPAPDTLRLRSAGGNAVFYWNFAPALSGLLRVGAANVEQRRALDGRHNTLSATIGLGLVVDLAPNLGLEAAWDATGSEGNNTGSTTASAVSVGLRIKF